MVFSDRVEEVCREFNSIHAHKRAKQTPRNMIEVLEAQEQTINFCLGMLGIPVVRDSCGYITAFQIMGGFKEVRS